MIRELFGLNCGPKNETAQKRVPLRESHVLHQLLTGFDRTITFLKVDDRSKVLCEDSYNIKTRS